MEREGDSVVRSQAIVGKWGVEAFERMLLAALWLTFATLKVGDPGALAAFLESEFAVPEALGVVSAWAIIVTEWFLGAVLAASVLGPETVRRICRRAVMPSAAISCVILLAALIVDPDVPCGCLGAVKVVERWQRVVLASALLFLSLGSRAESARRTDPIRTSEAR
jgi:hypothetical protein